MLGNAGWVRFAVAVASLFSLAVVAAAQMPGGRQSRPLITERVDESLLATLPGNVRPEARVENDRGPVADSTPMEHMLLQLRRPAEQEQALAELIEQLHNPASPNFHRWLTAQEFGERFGPAAADVETLTVWLQSHGFAVNVVYPSGMLIDFSGTAGLVRQAFHTPIHRLEVDGARHIANMSEPQLPAALATVVLGIISLHDFQPHNMHRLRPQYTFGGGATQAVVPADLATIYNLNPLFSAGVSGQGQTVVVIEDTDVFSTADWNTFRSTFGLSSFSSGSFTQVHPAPPSGGNNCGAPGVNGDDIEAILDAEWASAAAPSAAIELAACANTSTFGGLLAFQNLINGSSPPAVISISYGECEALNGAGANAAYNSAYQQAVAEGVSVFVSSGDEGAASCDAGGSRATHGIGVSAFASTPYNVAVGGTDFGDTFAGSNSTYWNSSNTATFGSAKSYIPEIPWNDSCASVLLATALSGSGTTYGSTGFCNTSAGQQNLTTASGSGGPSGCATGSPSNGGVVGGTCAGYAKPSWQSVFGNPSDGVRDIPDVSLFAANGVWGHYFVFCDSDTANGGAACTGVPSGWSGAGGTSFSSPIMAGIQALVNQRAGARQGNPNPSYYQLAATEYGSSGSSSCNSTLGNGAGSSCIFYDVTQGDMDVNCTGSRNCFRPSGTNGVLSTSNSAYSPAFGTTPGWDFATGIGTVNAANLVNNWPTANFMLSANPIGVTITQGGAAGTSTITVNSQNGFSGSVSLSASGLPTGVTASFNPTSTTTTSTLTLTAISTATPGTVNVTVTGTSGSLHNVTTITLTVAAQVAPLGNTAQYVRTDTATQGTWQSAYGTDGYNVIGDTTSYPAYATVTPSGQSLYTWAASTTDSRALEKSNDSGRVAATWYAATSFTVDMNLTDGQTHQIALYCVDWDSGGRSERIDILDAVAGTVLDTRNITGFSNGQYLVWNVSGHVTIKVTTTAGYNSVVSGLFFGGLPVVTSSTVQYVRTDTTTQGNWQSAYGADGYNVIGDTTSYPAYATVTPSGQSLYAWAASTTDVRALEKSNGSGRVAATWYATTSFTVDVNLTDGKTHPIALYCVDWDSGGRSERIDILDAGTGTVLDTRNITGFTNGQYLVWNVSGHVTVKVTTTAGYNSVVSGLFFGGALPMVISSAAQYVTTDTTTQGNWQSAYGADGYNIIGDTTSYPGYATVTPSGQSLYTWAASTTDVRALEKSNGSGRVAATWYAATSFTVDVNLTDGKAHQIALYGVDWDSGGRSQRIDILDAGTGTVLDTRSITGFSSGQYLVWNVSGHVIVKVTTITGYNSVVSGLFFGT